MKHTKTPNSPEEAAVGYVIEGWSELRPFGFIKLTGESCGIGIRVLVDLTKEALGIMEEFLSTKLATGNNWNFSDGQVASLMLPWEMWRDIAVYCCLKYGAYAALSVSYRDDNFSSSFVQGATKEIYDEKIEGWRKMWPAGMRLYFRSTDSGTGLRNQHFFSGRTQ